MSEKEVNNDFLPTSKAEEMNSSKIVISEVQKTPQIPIYDIRTKKKITITYFVMEILFVILSLFFVISNSLDFDLYIAGFIIGFFILGFGLITTYLYIFRLSADRRLAAFIFRFLSIITVIPLNFYALIEGPVDLEAGFYAFPFFLIIYSLMSQFLLKIYLLTAKKPIKDTLFRKAIAGSPSELEWRKYDSIPGLLAIITGIFL